MLEKYLQSINKCIDFLVASFVITKKCKHLKVYQQGTGKGSSDTSMQMLRTVQSLKIISHSTQMERCKRYC